LISFSGIADVNMAAAGKFNKKDGTPRVTQ